MSHAKGNRRRREFVCERCGETFIGNKPTRRFCSVVCAYSPRKLTPHPEDDSITLVPLTQGKIALIDSVDAESVGKHNWHADKVGNDWYAVRNNGRSRQYLHQFILTVPPGNQVDHASRDTLDCRRNNLREANRTQNLGNRGIPKNNTSGYKGVFLDGGQWTARITVQGKGFHLGRFPTPEDAAKAYDQAAKEHFGEFACLNFP